MSRRVDEFAPVAEHLRIVVNPNSSGAEVGAAIQALDDFLAKNAEDLPGDLRHFLARRSYHKAIIWIEESGPIPRGQCGRGE